MNWNKRFEKRKSKGIMLGRSWIKQFEPLARWIILQILLLVLDDFTNFPIVNNVKVKNVRKGNVNARELCFNCPQYLSVLWISGSLAPSFFLSIFHSFGPLREVLYFDRAIFLYHGHFAWNFMGWKAVGLHGWTRRDREMWTVACINSALVTST